MSKRREGIFINQNENWTWNIFSRLKLDVEFESRRSKEGRECGLRIFCPSKKEKMKRGECNTECYVGTKLTLAQASVITQA